MAVLMIGEVPNLTEEMYAGMLEGLKPKLQSSKGFIAHQRRAEPRGRLAASSRYGSPRRRRSGGSRRT